MSDIFADEKVIVALDGLSFERVSELIELIKADVWGFKFNDLLYHPRISSLLSREDINFFVDAKLHDIPNTVKNSVKRIVENYNPALLTVHASGGYKMLEAAVEAVIEVGGDTKILAITVLTSIDDATSRLLFSASAAEQVEKLAKIAREVGVFGVVCSPLEIEIVRKVGLRAIVPGIRPLWFAQSQDQKRVATPKNAIRAGASAIVVGRAITKAADPKEAAQKTARECREVDI